MSQLKRQDLIEYFKVGIRLKSWQVVGLQDPFAIMALAFLKKKERETISKTGDGLISMTLMDFERDSWMGLSKLRQVMELFNECSIGEFTSATATGGTKDFKFRFKADTLWFTTGSIKRPEQTQIFSEILFPDALWNDATLAPQTPHNKLVFIYLIQNTNYENGWTNIVREEPLSSMVSKTKYQNGLNDFISGNITEEITNRVPRQGKGYRTFIIKNPNFWGNKADENVAKENVKALQNVVFDFDQNKALEERSAEAVEIRRKIEKQYLEEATKVFLLNDDEKAMEDRDLKILLTFYNKGFTDWFDKANEVMDKINDKQPITREELTDAIDSVCEVNPQKNKASLLDSTKQAMVMAQARKRLKNLAPNLKSHEIGDQLEYYQQHGKFNLDVNFEFAIRPTFAPAPKKGRKKRESKNKVVTINTANQTQLANAQKARAEKAIAVKEQNKAIDPAEAIKQIEKVTKANEEAPKKTFIKPVEEPKQETPAKPTPPHKKTDEEMMIAVKFPFSLVKRIRDEKDYEKLKNFVPSLEDRKDADRHVKANAELAQEFCEEIGRLDIIEKYYFNSTDMAKFYSILSFFKHHAHLIPLDELEFYLINYEIFDWWKLKQGMPNYKDLI